MSAHGCIQFHSACVSVTANLLVLEYMSLASACDLSMAPSTWRDVPKRSRIAWSPTSPPIHPPRPLLQKTKTFESVDSRMVTHYSTDTPAYSLRSQIGRVGLLSISFVRMRETIAGEQLIYASTASIMSDIEGRSKRGRCAPGLVAGRAISNSFRPKESNVVKGKMARRVQPRWHNIDLHSSGQ
jgi:hypothetical protein